MYGNVDFVGRLVWISSLSMFWIDKIIHKFAVLFEWSNIDYFQVIDLPALRFWSIEEEWLSIWNFFHSNVTVCDHLWSEATHFSGPIVWDII